MAHSTTPLAGSSSRVRYAWSSFAEATLTLVAIAALLPLYDRIGSIDLGRDDRYAEVAVSVRGLPEPVLPKVCPAQGALADDALRERLCGRSTALFAGERGARVDRVPVALANAYAMARQAFVAPLAEAEARLAELRLRQREGVGDLLALGDAVESTSADIEPYVERYRIDAVDGTGPLPLACAFDAVSASFASRARNGATADRARANGVLLLAAALDGHPATSLLSSAATLPSVARASRSGCAGYELRDALADASALVAEARAEPAAIAKDEAMRSLLRTAGWQWAAFSLAGLALLQLSRRPRFAATGVALALATWAAAAWVGRVPWPFAGAHAFVPGRESLAPIAPPAPFVLWLAGASLVLFVLSPWLRARFAGAPQAPASPLGYPVLVAATGIGWAVLLDLSANGHYGSRYLALYHHGHLWLAMMGFTVVAFARQPLGRALGWTLAVIDGVASGVRARIGTIGSAAALVVLALALVGVVGALLRVQQVTSEIGRLWLIVGAAWFFFLRGTPLTERLARSGGSLVSLARYVAPLAFFVAVLIGAMLVIRNMGPLLIDAYGAGAFVAASVAMWWYQRTDGRRIAYVLAGLLFVAWILVTTATLFRFGAIDDVTAGRLENLAAPLASANDHLALVTWFQHAAPPAGFGLAAIPWCGYGASGACPGIPAQIQSDYTFTALVGAFGWTAAWTVTLGIALWLHVLVRRHGSATRGEPRFVRVAGRIGNDEQALLSWICLAWVVLSLSQLAVTVAGNLAVIPLTGVTFPFVSYGMTSLVVNMAMLALAINVNVHPRDRDG